MHFLHRFLFFLIAASMFYYVLNYIEPPKSWVEASTFQILAFFVPLLMLLTFFLNLFLAQVLRSFVASLGLMFALALIADKQFSPLYAAVTFFITGMIFTYTPKIKKIHLTNFKKLGPQNENIKEKHPEKFTKPPKVIKRL